MKKTLVFFALAAVGILAAGFVACQPDDTLGDGKIIISTESLEIMPDGGTKFINITGANWKAATNDEWLKIAEAEERVTVIIDANTSEEDRVGSITISNADDSRTVTVTQYAAGTIIDTSLNVDPVKLGFEAESATKLVTVASKLSWEATPSADWISITEAKSSFTVTVTANDSERERSGSITVANGKDTKTVAVTQAGVATVDPSLGVNPASLEFVAAGATKTVSVTSELSWEATPSDGWIAVNKSEGSFSVTVGANSANTKRTGSVVVDNGRNTKTVAIEQMAAGGMIVYVTNIELNKAAVTIKVGSSAQLSATVSPAHATDKDVVWSSNNIAVATVSESGLVVALSAGNATISATAADGSNIRATCAVTVELEDGRELLTNLTGNVYKRDGQFDLFFATWDSNANPNGPGTSGYKVAMYLYSTKPALKEPAIGDYPFNSSEAQMTVSTSRTSITQYDANGTARQLATVTEQSTLRITRNESTFTFTMDFVLSDNSVLKAVYTGPIDQLDNNYY